MRDNVSKKLACGVADALRFPAEIRPLDPGAVALPRFPTSGYGRGVNLFGYFRGQFGLGENARLYARALLHAGYPVALIDLDTDLPHARNDLSLDNQIGELAPYPINLVFVNPDHLDLAMRLIGPGRTLGKYSIACWFWELERFPEEWKFALALVDEVLVSTSFVQKAVANATDKPVTLVPIPIDEPVDSGRNRADFGIGNEFTFLTTFDFNSYLERKNPLAAVTAFKLAFTGQEKVSLLIKCSNGHRHPQRLRELIDFVMSDSRITLRDDILARSDIQALQRCCDAYISLHRSEGFGLGMAESMRLGKPVVATAYSGNMDFMTSENSCPVPFKMVPVLKDQYMHHEDQYWAEADADAAAAFMRRLVSDPNYCRSIGARAAADIRSRFSPDLSAANLIARFEQLPISLNGQ